MSNRRHHHDHDNPIGDIMPYSYLAQFQLAPLLTPENVAVLLGGIGVLITGVSYAVRSVADVKRMRAEVQKIHAQAEADDKASDNQQMTTLISILDRTVSVQTDFKDELVLLRKATKEGDEKIAGALNDYTAQTAALRRDLKAWPDAMSSSVSILSESVKSHDERVNDKLINLENAVAELKTRMEVAEANSVILNTFRVIIDDWPQTKAAISAIHRIAAEYDKPPDDTEPNDKPPAPSKTQALTIADGAKDAAVLDTGATKDEAA